jgi:hypothetical protein
LNPVVDVLDALRALPAPTGKHRHARRMLVAVVEGANDSNEREAQDAARAALCVVDSYVLRGLYMEERAHRDEYTDACAMVRRWLAAHDDVARAFRVIAREIAIGPRHPPPSREMARHIADLRLCGYKV